VKSIEARAFSHCGNLKSITISNGVKSIGDDAFSDCGSLASITIPSSVDSIGDWVFYECHGLKSITCLNPIPPYIRHFEGLTGALMFHTYNTCVYVPPNSVEAYRGGDVWNKLECIKPIGATENL
jgi:hypothetical protein